MSPDLSAKLAVALAHHRAGRVALAEPIYHEVLLHAPDHAVATHYLGLVAYAGGDHATAERLVRRSIDFDPHAADFHNNLGIVLRAAGRLPDAIAAFTAAADLKPNFAEAWSNLGNALRLADRAADAVAACERSLRVRPDQPEPLNNLGAALNKLGRHADAVAPLRRAVELKPALAEAHANLATALRELGALDDAERAVREALRLRPDYADARVLLGTILHRRGDAGGAVDVYRDALARQPGHADAHVNLGNALLATGQTDAALSAYRAAVALKPELVEAHNNVGFALQQLGDHDAAMAAYHRALQLRPNDGEVRGNRALLMLLRGDFRRGWGEYEWRFQTAAVGKARSLAQPRWDGTTDLAGRTTLLHAEQGLGDTIQFLRYAALVKARGAARVHVEVQRELAELAATCPGVDRVIPRGDDLGPFDTHCPLLSLPLVFRTDPSTVPAAVPYLRADPARVARWRDTLGERRTRLRVAVAWAGNPAHRLDRTRSIPAPTLLAPLLGMDDLDLLSVQKGHGSDQLAALPSGRVRDLGPELTTFGDTAAVLTLVDLLVTVDTSVAHLAGALGTTVWTLLPFAPDFRWMLDRPDTPWYPTMRLFRQPRPGAWGEVVEQVADELRSMSRRSRNG